jgi:hypothetical protein
MLLADPQPSKPKSIGNCNLPQLHTAHLNTVLWGIFKVLIVILESYLRIWKQHYYKEGSTGSPNFQVAGFLYYNRIIEFSELKGPLG